MRADGRAIVSVATGHFVRGLDRLTEWSAKNGEDYVTFRDRLPEGCPSHQDVPYAFKAYALTAAATACDTLLYLDSCMIPVAPLEPLWERIERDGYFIADQRGPDPNDKGYTNYEWTAYSAYPDLFPHEESLRTGWPPVPPPPPYAGARQLNKSIPHVVAGIFGISVKHPTGQAILDEYYRLASKTKAFCGPWVNANYKGERENLPFVGCCGPPDVRGHRHDQTVLSVIAWRLGCKLTRWPEVFAYWGHQDETTLVVADGGMNIK